MFNTTRLALFCKCCLEGNPSGKQPQELRANWSLYNYQCRGKTTPVYTGNR